MSRAANGTAARAAQLFKTDGTVTMADAARRFGVSRGAVSMAYKRLYPDDVVKRGRPACGIVARKVGADE